MTQRGSAATVDAIEAGPEPSQWDLSQRMGMGADEEETGLSWCAQTDELPWSEIRSALYIMFWLQTKGPLVRAWARMFDASHQASKRHFCTGPIAACSIGSGSGSSGTAGHLTFLLNLDELCIEHVFPTHVG